MAKNDKPVFQGHHLIEKQAYRDSELLQRLGNAQLFDLNGDRNMLNMPADKRLAIQLDVSPHNGGPLSAYSKGLVNQLANLEASEDGVRFLEEGDLQAGRRLAEQVDRLCDTLKLGLVDNKLLTNTPLGMTKDQAGQVNQKFFDDLGDFQKLNAQRLDAVGKLTGPEARWPVALKSEGNLLTSLQAIDRPGFKAVKGDPSEGVRGLREAVEQSAAKGNLSLSELGEASVRQRFAAAGRAIDHDVALGGERVPAARGLGEVEAVGRTLGRVGPRAQQGMIATELLLGEVPRNTLIRSGGLLVSGADLIVSGKQAADMAAEGNDLGAQSVANHALARNAGAWVGATAGSYMAGSAGMGPAAAVVAADAAFLAKAAEKGADLWDNREIYHQVDRDRVGWDFEGRAWTREVQMDRTNDGVDNPTAVRVSASYEKSRELSHGATNAAAKLAMAEVEKPLDPFAIPAQPSDQRGLDNPPWRMNTDTGQWLRQVKVGVSGANDRGTYEEEIASPKRSAELNQEAVDRVGQNIAHGREAVALRYLENRAAHRLEEFGRVPDFVRNNRPDPDALKARDGNTYHRQDGQWTFQGEPAPSRVAVELEITRAAWQPTLARHEQTVAALQARPVPTPEQQQQAELLYRYGIANTRLEPEWQAAIERASADTRRDHGLVEPGRVELLPNADRKIAADSPIAHYQTGPDGIGRIVATTTTEEIRAQLARVQGRAEPEPVQTLDAVQAVVPGMGKGRQHPDESPSAEPQRASILADNPAHPDFDSFNRIHEWVRGTGQWDDEKSRNVAGALYKEHASDPMLKRVDKVCGALGRDGQENVFAVYAPHGDQGPFYRAQVDGREACMQPAQQNLEQAEQIKQQQIQQQQLEKQQQMERDQVGQKAPSVGM